MSRSLLSCVFAVLALVALTVSSVQADDSKVIVLSEHDFEHLTQVATGATTGDWLVEFYAPWCGHCKKLAPIYEKVADELAGEINVAKVDVTKNSELGKRFGIRGFPTLMFFRHGRMYRYNGHRTQAELVKFTRGGYSKTESSPVPDAPTVKNAFVRHLEDLQKDFVTLLANKKNVLLATFSGGLVVGLLLGCLCGCCTRRSSAPKLKSSLKSGSLCCHLAEYINISGTVVHPLRILFPSANRLAMNYLYAVLSGMTIFTAQTTAKVVLLTSSNFDQVTQPTSSDWLVKFSSPYCSSCKDFEPTYERVATDLEGEMNVARVDMSTDAELGERFDIQMLPSVRLFRGGRVYSYVEDWGSVDEVVWFAREGYRTSEVSATMNSMEQQAGEL